MDHSSYRVALIRAGLRFRLSIGRTGGGAKTRPALIKASLETEKFVRLLFRQSRRMTLPCSCCVESDDEVFPRPNKKDFDRPSELEVVEESSESESVDHRKIKPHKRPPKDKLPKVDIEKDAGIIDPVVDDFKKKISLIEVVDVVEKEQSEGESPHSNDSTPSPASEPDTGDDREEEFSLVKVAKVVVVKKDKASGGGRPSDPSKRKPSARPTGSRRHSSHHSHKWCTAGVVSANIHRITLRRIEYHRRYAKTCKELHDPHLIVPMYTELFRRQNDQAIFNKGHLRKFYVGTPKIHGEQFLWETSVDVLQSLSAGKVGANLPSYATEKSVTFIVNNVIHPDNAALRANRAQIMYPELLVASHDMASSSNDRVGKDDAFVMGIAGLTQMINSRGNEGSLEFSPKPALSKELVSFVDLQAVRYNPDLISKQEYYLYLLQKFCAAFTLPRGSPRQNL